MRARFFTIRKPISVRSFESCRLAIKLGLASVETGRKLGEAILINSDWEIITLKSPGRAAVTVRAVQWIAGLVRPNHRGAITTPNDGFAAYCFN
jgi:hypothetical protein